MYRLLELIAWTAGILLLSTYVGLRTWAAFASDAGIDAMREARQQHAIVFSQAQTPATIASKSQHSLQLGQPDTSSWSAKRVAAYRESDSMKSIPQAVLRIPRLQLSVPVYSGTDDDTLNRGAGLIAGTAGVHAHDGNIGIAAHRDGFFRPLKDIGVGDAFFLETVTTTREYRVTKIEIVDPDNVGVLAPTSSGAITLVTCYPFYFVGTAPKRFIVHAQIQHSGLASDVKAGGDE